MDPIRYYHTLKHLKPVQIYGRLLYRLFTPVPDLSPAPPARKISGPWTAPARRRASLQGPARCRFLNEEHDIAGPDVWNDPSLEKLWLYNLHYFDYLNDANAEGNILWGRELIGRWVSENPPGKGTGWESYPTSLRIVNWIKWALAVNALEENWRLSLAVQTRWLARRLEFHLLGNHLFANAKALVFAGLFFEGPEADSWREKGMAILAREIPEQILPDGGHFELSPMYHALALEDMLDLANLAGAYPKAIPERWSAFAASWAETIGRMRLWLAGLCHPDGEIAFFNDAAIGIAPSPAELDAYAGRLGFQSGGVSERAVLELCGSKAALDHPHPYPLPREEGDQCRITSKDPYGFEHYVDSGYIRVCWGEMTALLDVARVGPDYLPGHAHADTLSFELSLHGRRVLVNSGTSRYGLGEQRLRQRGTAAHNTVTINGRDSSEVWGGFRVARRAKPFGLRIEENGGGLRVICSHDGYQRLAGKPVHRREWRFSDSEAEIVDTIEGSYDEAVGRLFFHPALKLFADAPGDAGHAEWADGGIIHWRVEGAASRIKPSTYHPEFGVAVPNQCLETRFSAPSCTIRLTWDT